MLLDYKKMYEPYFGRQGPVVNRSSRKTEKMLLNFTFKSEI